MNTSGQPWTGSPNGEDEASSRDGELAHLEAILTPCDVDDAMAALKPMFAALPRATPGDFAAFVGGFELVVQRYPLWVVKEVSAAFIEGRVAAHTSGFCPNTAQLGQELARRVAADQAKLAMVRRQAEDAARLASEPRRIPRAQDVKARGDAMVKRLREEADADRAKRNLAHRTGMTRAQIERERGFGGA